MEPGPEIGTLHSINERRTVHPSQVYDPVPSGYGGLTEAQAHEAAHEHALLVERLELAHETTASLVRQLERADALGARALDADQRNVEFQRRLVAAEREVDDLARHVAELERDHQALLSSASWRITRPLRKVSTFFRRVTGRPVSLHPR